MPVNSIISHLMSEDHRGCDDAFAAAEQAVNAGDWPLARGALDRFVTEMERHLGAEETLLFPAFEEATGMSMGPTRVMRLEHNQMRALFEALREAVEAQDAARYAGEAESLLILMQQHNLKEENVLYPMCDQHLAADSAAMCQNLAAAVTRG